MATIFMIFLRINRVVVSVSTPQSRDVPASRLALVSRKIVNISVSGRR